uniref:Uncharacterized protein n=1 Tax=Glossina austeni TaxID=7395 RepID=A0A1A9V0S1_GLOAU
MMPPANQKRAPDQPFPLSTERQTSSIPKATEDGCSILAISQSPNVLECYATFFIHPGEHIAPKYEQESQKAIKIITARAAFVADAEC